MRARPVPFCFHSFLPEPAHFVPRLGRVRARRAGPPGNAGPLHRADASFTGAPNTASARSSVADFGVIQIEDIHAGHEFISWPSAPPRNRRSGPGTAPLTTSTLSSVSTSNDFQVAHRHLLVAHVAGHAHARGTRATGSWTRRSSRARGGTCEPCELRRRGNGGACTTPANPRPLLTSDHVHFIVAA